MVGPIVPSTGLSDVLMNSLQQQMSRDLAKKSVQKTNLNKMAKITGDYKNLPSLEGLKGTNPLSWLYKAETKLKDIATKQKQLNRIADRAQLSVGSTKRAIKNCT